MDSIASTDMAWTLLVAGCLIIAVYEFRIGHLAHRRPMNVARTAHAFIRAEWVRTLMNCSGHEILAIQTLRNSVMSATVIGSTALLALMGTLSLASIHFVDSTDRSMSELLEITPRLVAWTLVIAVLFATVILSMMAVRFYNHAGYVVTMPTSTERKNQLVQIAEFYMVRAGNYYSMSMHAFLWVMPMAVGLLAPVLFPLAAIALVGVLTWFDRVPVIVEKYVS